MSWFKSKEEQLRDNLYDEQVHAQVAREIAANQIWPGLQLKAFAEAQGNEVKAKAIYVRLRTAQIKLGVDVEAELVNRVERLLTTTPVNNHAPNAAGSTPNTGQGRCNTCNGRNIKPRDPTSGQTFYCYGCQKFLYFSSGDIVFD